MKEFTDQAIARKTLEVRDQGYKRAFWRLNSKRYLLLAVFYFAVIMASFAYLPTAAGYITLGIAIGAFARDYRWVSSSRQMWPFYLKVLDWEKVERFAQAADDAGTAT